MKVKGDEEGRREEREERTRGSSKNLNVKPLITQANPFQSDSVIFLLKLHHCYVVGS